MSPVSHAEWETTDPELAHEWISRVYAEHAPRLSGDREGFRMRAASTVTDLFRVDRLRHSMSVEADCGQPRGLTVVHTPHGRYRVTADTETQTLGPGGLLMVDPLRPMQVAWDDLDVELVLLDLEAVASVAAGVSGLAPERVRFGFTTPLDAGRARYWARTLGYVTDTILHNPAAAAEPLVRADALRTLATAATLTFPNTALDAVLDPTATSSGAGEPAALRRAVAFIDAHAHQPVTVAEIAEQAGLSVRALQAGFRRHRDQTPLDYLHQARRAGAHRDLQAADPTRGDTVAAIAARWGFSNPGRFSVTYRQAYGHPPSQTLRD